MNKIYDITTKKNYTLPPDLFLPKSSCLLDELSLPYKNLVAKIGRPNQGNDGYKTDAEWLINTPVGVGRIYNYKDGRNYNGKDGLKINEITDWHIGGDDLKVADEIKLFIYK